MYMHNTLDFSGADTVQISMERHGLKAKTLFLGWGHE